MNLDARAIAAALGGEVSGRDAVLAPGPGHSPGDRSLSVKLCLAHNDGFIVHSFCGDDVNRCRDHVKAKLGLDPRRPRVNISRDLSRARRRSERRPNGTNGHHAAPLVNELSDDGVIVLPTLTLPARTPPDAGGKPAFMTWGAEGPPKRPDEQRRHFYVHNGVPVRIKVMNVPGAINRAVNWYRVADQNETPGWQARLPDGYAAVPYAGKINPFDPEVTSDRLYWPEGEKDVDTVAAAGGLAVTFGGVGDGLPEGIERFIAGRDVVVLADNDEPGRKHARCKIEVALSVAKSVRLVEFPELPRGGDVSNWFEQGGTIEALHVRADEAPDIKSIETDSAKAAPLRHLVVQCAADIRPEAITWFWPQRIAIGKLTLLAGQPGLGKSQITASLAAATTTGGSWPCDEGTAPLGSVIVLSAEDDPADTQIPRLLAAGADCRKVQIVSAVREKDAKGNRTFNIQADMDLIEGELDRLGDVSLITIDPLSSYLGKVDSHNNTDVRGVLELLSEMAARRKVAIVGVTHFNKGDGAAINKVIGSIAFVAAARAAFMVAVDPDDESRRLFVGIKNNVGRTAGALAFRVLQMMVGENQDIVAPYIHWDSEPVSGTTADQILAAAKGSGDGERSAKAEVVDFLSSILATGPLSADAIQEEAVAAGHLRAGAPIGKDKTFRLAKEELGIRQHAGTVYREGGAGAAGRWFWRLPAPKAPQNPYGAPVSGEGALDNSGRLSSEVTQ
jgi:hypothetical protein